MPSAIPPGGSPPPQFPNDPYDPSDLSQQQDELQACVNSAGGLSSITDPDELKEQLNDLINSNNVIIKQLQKSPGPNGSDLASQLTMNNNYLHNALNSLNQKNPDIDGAQSHIQSYIDESQLTLQLGEWNG